MGKSDANLFDHAGQHAAQQPLAERVRPQTLQEIVGHQNIIGPQSPLRRQVKNGHLPSIIFWGPPGVGKTTLALLLAAEAGFRFESISAVSSGVKDVKRIIETAAAEQRYYQQKTVLFIDEIHRFNKAQQDALLHAVEDGTLILIGATTENPSFEVNAPLLSRCQVIKLEELSLENLKEIVQRALKRDILLSRYSVEIEDEELLITAAGGDARRILNLLETTFHLAEKDGHALRITRELIKQAATQIPVLYDKKGEYHYDTISAFIKSVRGSDPDGALYWLAAMLEGGEEPTFIARRLIVLASEDIGNAEPYALSLANACFEAVKNVGMPEARIILAQVTAYLASLPKSNAAYLGIEAALDEIRNHGVKSVPLHLRNAPTKLMKQLEYGRGYQYPHSFEGHYVAQEYLPKELSGKIFYQPGNQGREAGLKEYLRKKRESRRDTEN